MAKSNYTDPSLTLLPCVFSHSSPLKLEGGAASGGWGGGKKRKEILLPTAIFHREDEECRHVGAPLLFSLGSSLAH